MVQLGQVQLLLQRFHRYLFHQAQAYVQQVEVIIQINLFILLVLLEKLMLESAFKAIMFDLMEAIHVELPNEAVHFIVTEVTRKNNLLEFNNVFNDKLEAVWCPVNNLLILLHLQQSKKYPQNLECLSYEARNFTFFSAFACWERRKITVCLDMHRQVNFNYIIYHFCLYLSSISNIYWPFFQLHITISLSSRQYTIDYFVGKNSCKRFQLFGMITIQFDTFLLQEIIILTQLLNMLRIFIIGTTGVGKTKLSIQLAKYLKGQIISSDSKQLYKYATIMTAKVTQQQAEGIPHHMIDVLELHQNTYNRNKYFAQAFDSLNKIEEKGKIPITVGGTNYYTETLLYDLERRSANQSDSDQQGEKAEDKEKIAKQIEQIKQLTKDQRYNLLKQYDSLIAQKIHRNNQQKINLFLERIIKNRSKVSDNYQSLTHKLKHKNTLVFWLRNSDKDELLDMITKRIRKMLDKNGITQIFTIYHYLHLHKAFNQSKQDEINYEEYSGAASSIGIKQFLNLYQEVRDQLLILIPLKKEGEITKYEEIHVIIFNKFQEILFNKETLEKCTQQLIMDTKHYCKRQITWIKNRMFLNQRQIREHFFVLDLQQQEGDKLPMMKRFQNQIKAKAIEIIQQIKNNGFGSITENQHHFCEKKIISLQDWKKYFCEPCSLQINGEYDWIEHIKSKRHIKQVKYLEKKDQREKYIQQQKAKSKSKREQINNNQVFYGQENIVQKYQEKEQQKKQPIK